MLASDTTRHTEGQHEGDYEKAVTEARQATEAWHTAMSEAVATRDAATTARRKATRALDAANTATSVAVKAWQVVARIAKTQAVADNDNPLQKDNKDA